MNKEQERKINEVESRLDRKPEPYVGQKVRINQAAPYFNEKEAAIALYRRRWGFCLSDKIGF